MTISLAFLAPDLVKAAMRENYPTEWAFEGFAICRRNDIA